MIAGAVSQFDVGIRPAHRLVHVAIGLAVATRKD